MIGESPAFLRARALAERVARFSLNVLITGETGTGKEVFSRFIHQQSSRAGELVPVNCGGLAESIAEAELFGHVKGAFTGAGGDKPGYFQHAHNGTLFLDELGELPLGLQVKLLRVLEDGQVYRVGSRTPEPVNVRVVSATHAPLHQLVKTGRFRRDLFERLCGFELVLPPLRDRGTDVLLLAEHLLATHEPCVINGPMRLETSAEVAMQTYSWPGNVRELRRLLGALAVEGIQCITADHLAELVNRAEHGTNTNSTTMLDAAQLRVLDTLSSLCYGVQEGVTMDALANALQCNPRGLQRQLAGPLSGHVRRLGSARSTRYLPISS